jgi:hypothetical protein
MAIKLARLPVNWQENPLLVSRYWDQSMTQIETALNQILAIPAIEAALVDLDAAIIAADAAAAAADAAAVSAQTAADDAAVATAANKAESSIINSYVSLFTAPLISVTTLGVVTIANHSRIYGDPALNPTVTVTGTAALATTAGVGDVVRVYYNDPTRAGGAVTYLYTVDPTAPPVQGGSTHSVGAVTVPGAGSANGKLVQPPGYIDF